MMRFVVFLLLGVVVAVVNGTSVAVMHEVALGPSEVIIRAPDAPSAAPYYLVQVGMPEAIRSGTILEAYLEFHADVSAVTLDGWENETPVIEMYVIDSALSGDPAPTQLRKPSAMIRNVRIGENRRVRINVTEALRYFLDNPTKNFGMVLGSFRGAAEGRFTIRNDQFAGGTLVRMTIITRE